MYDVWWDTRPIHVHGVQEFASVPENKRQTVKLIQAIGFKEECQSTVTERRESHDEQHNVLETGSGPVIEISSF
jgi:hypothetical protein